MHLQSILAVLVFHCWVFEITSYEPPYDSSDHASKVTSDRNLQFPWDTLKSDDLGGKIEQDVILAAKDRQVCASICLSQSCNGSGADPINNLKNESDFRAAPCPYAASEIILIAQNNLFYMDKTVTDDDEAPHLSVPPRASPTVKDICMDEGAQMFEKIMVEYDKVDQAIFSSSNFPRVNGNSAIMEETRKKENSEDLESSLTDEEGLDSLRKISEIDVGDREFSSPSKCATYLNETIDKTAKNDFESFLVTGYPVEQCYCSSSGSERRPLDTMEAAASMLPYEEAIDQRSHFLEEVNTDFLQVDSCSNNDSTSEIQAAEEEEDLKTMASSSPEKAKESKLIPGTVSSNQDLFEEDKTSVNYTDSNSCQRDDPKIEGVASTSDPVSGDTSIVVNGNKIVYQQTLQSQNGVETEEPASDGASSARSSFSHLAHGDSNLLGPDSITASHVPYSGNISLRSESSTTSGQSFAFPILQPEWSSSPVRMAKADRRHLRKHRWKTALTCCKF